MEEWWGGGDYIIAGRQSTFRCQTAEGSLWLSGVFSPPVISVSPLHPFPHSSFVFASCLIMFKSVSHTLSLSPWGTCRWITSLKHLAVGTRHVVSDNAVWGLYLETWLLLSSVAAPLCPWSGLWEDSRSTKLLWWPCSQPVWLLRSHSFPLPAPLYLTSSGHMSLCYLSSFPRSCSASLMLLLMLFLRHILWMSPLWPNLNETEWRKPVVVIFRPSYFLSLLPDGTFLVLNTQGINVEYYVSTVYLFHPSTVQDLSCHDALIPRLRKSTVWKF